ncbi:PAS domain S-box protein [Larkinella soli]|uniref:PAS domain S-box protein n=1 Tax=Larkinella soli TaxID=1770527 RepID=UPI000FFC1C93|nr:PAS domain S-box protein [Larkinella soli]
MNQSNQGPNPAVSAEENTRRQTEKLLQLVENAKDYMSMATLEGQMTYMNRAARRLVGLPADADLSSLHFQDFYSPRQIRIVREEIIPALDRNGSWSGPVCIKHLPTQEEIPCYANYALIYDPDNGQVISRSLMLRDLRPELEARKELEDSEKRFENLVQQAPVATAIYTGREMTIQWANPAMIKLWGKDSSVIGTTVRVALPELEGQPFHDLLDRVFTTGEMYQASEDRGDLVVDGVLQTFYFNFSYKPLRDSEGRIYAILNMAIDVTEQVITRRRLEESENNFRSLIMQAPIGICLLTGEDFITEIVNDQYLELVGRTREGFMNRPIWELLPEARAQGFDRILSEVKRTGTPYVGNESPVMLVRNGRPETLYVNFVYEPLFDTEGRAHSVLVLSIDITQQVRSRQLIKETADRARLAVESGRMGSYEVDFLTGVVIGSPRFNELFDLETTGLQPDYVSRIHPDDLPKRAKAHEVALRTGVLEYECRVIRRDQSINWLRIYGQYYFNEEGQPIHIIGIVQDITLQKTAEEEREKFLALSFYSRDFIAMCDMNMKTLYVNKGGIELLGIEGPVEEQSLWDCFFPEDHAFLRDQFFPQVLRDGHAEVEIRFRHFRTGRPVWVIYSVFVIYSNQGEPSVLATVSRDITERKTMEEELERRVQERTAQLRQLNDELQQFSYISSHDLKEPLRKIQVFADMAQQESDPANTVLTDHLQRVRQSAKRMSGLLADLLSYALLGNPERQFARIDLNQVLRHIQGDLELMIREKQSTLSIGPLPVVEGIPFQINQLFYNLVHNAVKFTNTEGEPSEVRIGHRELSLEDKLRQGLSPARVYHQVDITDNGIGFRQDMADKVFVVFKRLHTREEYSGNGIGLSICKKIAENHGGRIMVRSVPGEGSTFSVILPQVQG